MHFFRAIKKNKDGKVKDGENIEHEINEKERGNDLKNIIKNLKKIEMRIKEMSRNIVSGEYRSIFKGSGIEFSEIREYKAGDDIKRIDWKATSRLKTTFVKEYIEERNINICFAIDVSSSTEIGSDAIKRIKMAEVVGIIALSALENNDYISSILFTDTIEKYTPFKKGKRHIFRIIRDVLTYKPKHKKTNLANAIRKMSKVIKRRSVIVLLTDLIDESNFYDEIRKVSKRHNVLVVNVYDSLDIEIPYLDATLLAQDPETGETIIIEASDKDKEESNMLEMFRENRRKEIQDIKKRLRRINVPFIAINTSQSIEEVYKTLVMFFK